MVPRFVYTAAVLAVVACATATPGGRDSRGRPCGAAAAVPADTVLDAGAAWPAALIRPVRGELPQFPEVLRERGVSGEVRSSFVVDTLGRMAEGSARIVEESRREFGDAVCASLAGMEFTPVVVGGRRVSARIVNVRTHFEVGR